MTALLMTSAYSAASSPVTFPTELPEYHVQWLLVAGHVVAVDRDGPKNPVQVTVRAEKVFWGDQKYLGLQFSDYYVIGGSTFFCGLTPMVEGDAGLWLIQISRRHPLTAVYRVLAKKDEPYKDALEVARFLEAVYPADKAGRERLARAAVTHQNPAVGMSALHVLAAYAEKPGMALLAAAEIKGLDLRVQLTVDDLLCEKKVPGWDGTERRKAWVRGWLPQVTSDDQAGVLRSAILGRMQRRNLPTEYVIDTLLRLARNDKLSERTRRDSLGDMVFVVSRTGEVDEVFRALVQVITEDSTPELRRAAAACLPVLIKGAGAPHQTTLSTDQIDKLNGLVRTEKDKFVADRMVEAVLKATDAKFRDK